MFGLNKVLPVEHSDGNTLKIKKIFATIQGEGPYSGYPAVFIRLSGCNLACSFCDTDFDSYEELSINDIIDKVKSEWKAFISYNNSQVNHSIRELNLDQSFKYLLEFNKPLIVITGGEPLRQNITQLCSKLLEYGLKIQLESNGTIYRDLPKEVEIVCSPKNTGKGYFPIRDDILRHTIAIKFLVSVKREGYQEIAEVGQSAFKIRVYVQPMDDYDQQVNSLNLKLATKIAIKSGAILSLQIHKILEIE